MTEEVRVRFAPSPAETFTSEVPILRFLTGFGPDTRVVNLCFASRIRTENAPPRI